MKENNAGVRETPVQKDKSKKKNAVIGLTKSEEKKQKRVSLYVTDVSGVSRMIIPPPLTSPSPLPPLFQVILKKFKNPHE